jgi:hypothetical protein
MPVILVDQEDSGSRPAQANSSQDPVLKKTHHRKGLVEWHKVQAPVTTTTKKTTLLNCYYGQPFLS